MKTIDTCLIFGTRSWARVLLGASVEAFSPRVRIMVVDDSFSDDFADWLKIEGLSGRVSISPCFPTLEKDEVGVAVVSNAAPLHSITTQQVLKAGYHAVVEKPLSFSMADSISLVDTARKSRRHLFSTNIPLFAGYLDDFRAQFVDKSVVSHAQVEWTDPAFEFRHGTRKSYDSATPLIFDVLPHITTILWALFEERPLTGDFGITVAKGGARVRIFFEYGGLPVTVNLARNADRRVRRIQIFSEEGNSGLDFSIEPPVIGSATRQSLSGKRPSVEMLEAVASSCLSESRDPRLTVKTNILANDLVEKVLHSYVEQQVMFLQISSKKRAVEADDSYRYARKEAKSVTKRLLPNLAADSPLRLFERYEEFQ